MHTDHLIALGILTWFLFAIFWVYPLKRDLQKKHGFDKNNDYFAVLAQRNDPLALLMKKRTKILFVIGVMGGVVMAFTK